MSNLIFPIDVARYTNDTYHLTCEQDGAYWRILRKMWTEGGSIPNDERTLTRLCGMTPKRWRSISPPIMAMLMVVDGRLTQKRLSADLAQLTAAKSQAGKASGRARKSVQESLFGITKVVSKQPVASDNQLDLLNGHEQVFRAHNADAPARVGGDSTSLKEEVTGKKQEDSTNVESKSENAILAAVESYATLAEKIGLPGIRALNDDRQKKLSTILDQYGLPVWNEALTKLETSHFLRGENDRGWVANFDFMVQPSSFLKLIEGRYNDRPVPQVHAHSPPSPQIVGDEIDEMIRREREKEQRNVRH